MKTLKMKGLLVAMLLMVLQWTTTAQGIRKEWHEMTANEKLSLMEAMKYAQDEFGTYYKMGYFHGQRFSEIHFNPPAQDQFGAWHRWAIFTLERDLQKFQPELSMPFWDWTTYNTKGDEMWDAQHLGQFDNTSNWFAPLNRHVTSSFPLPTTADVNSVLSISDWDTFNNTLETGSVHVGGHVWTGGTMASGTSPWDPVFFFHHNTVDKVWQEWVDAGGVPSYNVSLLSNSLNGNSNYLWPENIDPDDLHDSKTIGVFFAENGHVTLEEYAVTNDYRTNEVFFYQFDIETGDNFTVPTGKQAEIKSFSSITLEPGFEAEAGSNVQIEIVNDALFDTDCNCTATNQLPSGAKIADGTDDIGENVYENIRTSVTELKLYPNPASDFVVIEADKNAKIEIFSTDGVLIQEGQSDENGQLMLELFNLDKGVYLIQSNNKTQKLMVK